MGIARFNQLNPATIMTDPSTADATYVEPLTVDMLEKVIQKETMRDIITPMVKQALT